MRCKNCNNDVIGKGVSYGKFCCQKCKWTWMNNNRKLKPNFHYKCIECGKDVSKYISPSRVGRDYTLQFCDRTCKGKYMTGDKHPLWAGGKKYHNKQPIKPNYKGICKYCMEEFETYRNKTAQEPKFCSVQCTGRYQTNEKNPAYNGGKYLCNGYHALFLPDHPYASKKNIVLEHRVIMEKKIGRYLKPEEVVHHKDGIKTNNDPNNLILFKNNSDHMKYHAKLKKENKIELY